MTAMDKNRSKYTGLYIYLYFGMLFLSILARAYYIAVHMDGIQEQVLIYQEEAAYFLKNSFSFTFSFNKWYYFFVSRLFLFFGIKEQVLFYFAFFLLCTSFLPFILILKDRYALSVTFGICLLYEWFLIGMYDSRTFDILLFRQVVLSFLIFAVSKCSLAIIEKLNKEWVFLPFTAMVIILAALLHGFRVHDFTLYLLLLILLFQYGNLLLKRENITKEDFVIKQDMIRKKDNKTEQYNTRIEDIGITQDEIRNRYKESDSLDFPYRFSEEELKYDYDFPIR